MDKRAFTLIELLIVVAIIAILAAIAVPNFLEAQTRAKISRSRADMRAIDTAIQTYVVDYNNEPATDTAMDPSPNFSNWWGFVGHSLTTPISYITTRPIMPFRDKSVLSFWQQMGGTAFNQPYTIIRDTGTSRWTVGVSAGGKYNVPVPKQWRELNDNAGYVVYTAGADSEDSTVWGAPQFYDASNGTISFGDIYHFGSGSPNDDDRKN